MDDLITFQSEFENVFDGYVVVIDGDGRVVYGYLVSPSGEIVSDVWLYNICATPAEPEWLAGKEMPFANSLEFEDERLPVPAPKALEDFSVSSVKREGANYAQIFFNGKLVAELSVGAKPGWSLFAKKSGPLAQVLEGK